VAGKKERQRQLARDRYARREQRRVQRSRRTRQWTISALAAVVVVAVGVGAFLLAGQTKPAPAAAKPKASPSASITPSASPSASPTAAAPVAEPAHHCAYAASPPAARKVSFPPSAPDYRASFQATIKTSRGSIAISLLNSKATCTVNSFVHLAEQGYFSGTSCHRLTTAGIFVLQCGDPTGTGQGGPGYRFADENLAGAKYTAGTVAMANAGPGTNGSQFFLVYKNSPLPANYTPFGTITAGLNIIQSVAVAGSDNANGAGDGHPKEKVTIEGVTIKKA
jgi:peptidyl-prolyl cis-trans isomerase B (cyclophilin B)